MAFGNLMKDMGLGKNMELLKSVGEKAAELTGATMDTINALLDEYKKAVDMLAAFGFSVGKFNVSMGLLPGVETSIVGSIAGIRKDALQKLIDEHPDNALVNSMLSALITAKALQERVDLQFESVHLNVALGVPPSITVEFD